MSQLECGFFDRVILSDLIFVDEIRDLCRNWVPNEW